MEIKKATINLLKALKEIGYDRRGIEKDLGYADKSIDQIVSKGGNSKFLKNLEDYYQSKSNKSNIEKVIPDKKNNPPQTFDGLIESNKILAESHRQAMINQKEMIEANKVIANSNFNMSASILAFAQISNLTSDQKGNYPTPGLIASQYLKQMARRGVELGEWKTVTQAEIFLNKLLFLPEEKNTGSDKHSDSDSERR